MSGPPVTGLTYNSPISFFISQNPPDALSSESPAIQQAFTELYNSVQQIIQVFINTCGIGQQTYANWAQLAGSPSTILSGNLRRFYVTAIETIAFGAIVSLYSPDSVTIYARNANATDATRPADGFCTTVGGIQASQVGEIMLSTGVIPISGLVAGAHYFLSTVDGLVTTVPPVSSGSINQYIGIAVSTTVLYANFGIPTVHA